MTTDEAIRIYSHSHDENRVQGFKSRAAILLSLSRARTGNEIAAHTGLADGVVRHNLTVLRRMGLIEWQTISGIKIWSRTPSHGAKNGVSA